MGVEVVDFDLGVASASSSRNETVVAPGEKTWWSVENIV